MLPVAPSPEGSPRSWRIIMKLNSDMKQSQASHRGDVACRIDDGFVQWLSGANCSLAVTTYQAGKLLFLGWNGKPTLNARHFSRAMGMACRGEALALATDSEIHLFHQAPLLSEDLYPDTPNRYDTLYLERSTYHTGDVFCHDLAYTDKGLVFVNTRFSCISTLSNSFSFEPIWHPHFIQSVTPGDLCHLNGLAVRDGALYAATALGVSSTAEGWRNNKNSGGVVIDIDSNEIVLNGLAMPHSPRWHGDNLWVLNSGKGDLLRLSQKDGKVDHVCHLSSYLRGLAFHGETAIIGLCKIREKKVFGGLPIENEVDQLMCGIALIDLNSGCKIGTFEFTAGVEEIYDIHVLPGVSNATIYTSEHSIISGAFTAPEFSYWIRADDNQV